MKTGTILDVLHIISGLAAATRMTGSSPGRNVKARNSTGIANKTASRWFFDPSPDSSPPPGAGSENTHDPGTANSGTPNTQFNPVPGVNMRSHGPWIPRPRLVPPLPGMANPNAPDPGTSQQGINMGSPTPWISRPRLVPPLRGMANPNTLDPDASPQVPGMNMRLPGPWIPRPRLVPPLPGMANPNAPDPGTSQQGINLRSPGPWIPGSRLVPPLRGMANPNTPDPGASPQGINMESPGPWVPRPRLVPPLRGMANPNTPDPGASPQGINSGLPSTWIYPPRYVPSMQITPNRNIPDPGTSQQGMEDDSPDRWEFDPRPTPPTHLIDTPGLLPNTFTPNACDSQFHKPLPCNGCYTPQMTVVMWGKVSQACNEAILAVVEGIRAIERDIIQSPLPSSSTGGIRIPFTIVMATMNIARSITPQVQNAKMMLEEFFTSVFELAAKALYGTMSIYHDLLLKLQAWGFSCRQQQSEKGVCSVPPPKVGGIGPCAGSFP